MSKQEALDIINAMPENTSFEDAFFELYVISNIKAGLNDLKEGQVHSHEEARKMFANTK